MADKSMRIRYIASLFLAGLLAVACAQTSVTARVAFPEDAPRHRASECVATLNGGEHTALTNAQGEFTFHNVPKGIYTLAITSPVAVFEPVRWIARVPC